MIGLRKLSVQGLSVLFSCHEFLIKYIKNNNTHVFGRFTTLDFVTFCVFRNAF